MYDFPKFYISQILTFFDTNTHTNHSNISAILIAINHKMNTITMIASQKNLDKFEIIQNQALRILIEGVKSRSLDAMLFTTDNRTIQIEIE